MNERPRIAIHDTGVLGLQSLALIILLSLPAPAGNPGYEKICPGRVPNCAGKMCCDDYCPKREPCVGVSLCFRCDDYCAKKVPCVRAPLCFGCDDYCKKCPPKVCNTPRCQFLKCGSTQCSNATCDELPCDALASTLPE